MAHQHSFFKCSSNHQTRDNSANNRSVRASPSRRRKRIFSESNQQEASIFSTSKRTEISRQPETIILSQQQPQPIITQDLRPHNKVVVILKKPLIPLHIAPPVAPLTIDQPIKVRIPAQSPREAEPNRKQPYTPNELRTMLTQMRPSSHHFKRPYLHYRR